MRRAVPALRSLLAAATAAADGVAVAGRGGGRVWPSSPHLFRFASTLPPHTTLAMPALSPTMAAGNIAAWHVGVGDAIAPGDVLADIETDKATLAWENQDDGVVAALLAPAGAADVAVGTPLVVLVEDAGSVKAFEGYEAPKVEGKAAAAPAAATAAPTPSPSSSAASTPARLIAPAAARVLREAGLAAEGLAATGPRGTLTKEDAVAAVAAAKAGKGGAAKPAAPAAAAAPPRPAAAPRPAPTSTALPPPRPGLDFTDVPHTQVRRVIAARLTESKATVPHAYARADARLGAVAALRSELKSAGVRASVNDFVIAAAARALIDVPAVNVTWDAAAGEARAVPSVDVCVAVATDGGLLTPIVTAAPTRSLADIGATVRDLADRARAGKLQPHEFQGGSFTISNLGMYGVTHFSAIINPPQAAILAVGGTRAEPVMKDDGSLAFDSVVGVTLSYDARAVEAADAAAWLDAFGAHLEAPERLVEGMGG